MATVMQRAQPRTYAEYAALRGVNWGTLSELKRSPKHYRYRLENPREDSPRMAFGRAVHCAILQPLEFGEQWVVYDGSRRTNAWQDFKAAHADKDILTSEEYERVLDARDAVWSHKDARRLLRRGRTEVTLRWVDPLTHVRCKARLDHLCGAVLTDLKTTADVEARTFGRLATRMGYIEQLAFYRRGLIATGRKEAPVYIVAVEQEAPHDVAVLEVDEDALAAGEDTVLGLLELLQKCRHSGSWPGRYPRLGRLDVPGWYFDSADDEELELMGLKARSKS